MTNQQKIGRQRCCSIKQFAAIVVQAMKRLRGNSHAFQLPPVNKEAIVFYCRIINFKVFILQKEYFNKQCKPLHAKKICTMIVLKVTATQKSKKSWWTPTTFKDTNQLSIVNKRIFCIILIIIRNIH